MITTWIILGCIAFGMFIAAMLEAGTVVKGEWILCFVCCLALGPFIFGFVSASLLYEIFHHK